MTSDTAMIVLGIDVGGTKIAAGLVQFPNGEVLAERSIPTNSAQGGPAVLDRIVRLAETLAAEARARGQTIFIIGLGLCELVDPTGRIFSHNCLNFTEPDIRARLAHLSPLVVEADVRAGALAEAMFGAGRAYRIFLYVSVGTGIASCLMLDGAPYLGARGATGTMASSPIRVPCERCGHISRQTLEEIASGRGLVARYNRLKPGSAKTGQEVLAAAVAGDDEGMRVVQTASEALESAVGLLVNVLDPEAVVVGGGLGLSEGPFWDGFIASTRKHIWSEVHRNLPILRAQTGVRAGFMGAAAAAWKKAAMQ